MIKLFLVEDEIIMRDGIKNNIDWQQEGILFAGEASDGELAYPMILKEKPDILITDIKMPFMDGLELCELVRKELPDMKVIILSGYDDFSYAQKAVRLNVTEYLLKPISPQKLLETIRKVAEEIRSKQRQSDQYSELSQQAKQERQQLDQQRFFRQLITNRLPMTEILEKGKSLDMELSAPWYQIILCYMDITGGNSQMYSEEQNQLMEQVQDCFAKIPGWYTFDRGTEGVAILAMADTPEQMTQKISDSLDQLVQILQKFQGMQYFIGVGSCVKRLRELGDSYNDANKAFSYRYMTQMNQIIYASNMNTQEEQAMDLQELNIKQMDRSVVQNFLRSGAVDEVPHFLQEYFDNLGRQNSRSLIFLQYVMMDIYFCIVSFLEEIGYKIEDITEEYGDINEVIKKYYTLEKVEEYFGKVFGAVIRLRDNVTQKRYSTILQKAKAFIDENYNREDISLNTVAAQVNVSPNHFSSVFSQEMGQTFIEYLTGIRMKKAKELLMTTNKKSSEIAYEIGYKDPHYFSFMFKKTQGCTAREYRSRAQ